VKLGEDAAETLAVGIALADQLVGIGEELRQALRAPELLNPAIWNSKPAPEVP